jgi:RimJ/RimL family protein N-acetyltransferase
MIETGRLTLRKMTLDDTDDLLSVFSDPRVMQSFGGELFDRVQMERWVRRNLAHQEQYGFGLFSVILRAEQLLVGDCGLERMEVGGEPEVEIGYDIRSDYWGRGIATEAAAAVRDFAFGRLRLPRVVSLIRPDNVASRRVSEKIGMAKEKEIIRGGQPYWVYALSRGEERSGPTRAGRSVR